MKTTKISKFEASDPDAGMTFGELTTIVRDLEGDVPYDRPVMNIAPGILGSLGRTPIRALEIVTEVQDD